MKIAIFGGTGLVGQALGAHWTQEGHQVMLWDRTVFARPERLADAVKATEIVVNLSGENIARRWTATYKKALWSSRIDTTQQIVEAIQTLVRPPKLLISTSAIGFYPERCAEKPCHEGDPHGEGFLSELCQAWEAEALKCTACPVVITRLGVVLSRKGGALKEMRLPFKLGLGGPVAGGEQAFSWIHQHDLCRAYSWILAQGFDNNHCFNLTTPEPLKQKDWGRLLAQAMHRPFGLPMPEWVLKGIFGEGAQVLTHSSAVIPKALLDSGFVFNYPTAESAIKALVNEPRHSPALQV